jgi:8-oxo-dGTP pyrophosphatase MutT (NUDIX family)
MPIGTSKDAPIKQSGVIPYRVRQGRLEVALVTARSGTGWTIPKGHIEPDLSPDASAAKEALEEAGLTGAVGRRIIGTYSYEKRGGMRRVMVFAMRVRAAKERWPEMHERRRRWFSLEQAATRVRCAELRCCIQQFSRKVQRRRAMAA